jgi:hypothetical protein
MTRRLVIALALFLAAPILAETNRNSRPDANPHPAATPDQPKEKQHRTDFPIFRAESLDDLIEESKRDYRPLLLYFRGEGKAFDECDNVTWKNTTLRAWVEWHAIAVRIDMRERPDLVKQIADNMRIAGLGAANPQGRPMVFVFRRGVLDRIIPDPAKNSGLFGNPLGTGFADPEKFFLKPTTILLQMDFYLEKLRSADPAWSEMHTQKNPEPPSPPRKVFAAEDDGLGAPVPDIQQKPGEPSVFLARWREAQDRTRDRSLFEAAGLHTWLWENGIDDPVYRPIVRTLLASAMRSAAATRQGSRKRYAKLRDEHESRRLWWYYTDFVTAAILSEIAGEDGQSKLLEVAADQYEETLELQTEGQMWDLLQSRKSWIDPSPVSPQSLSPQRVKWRDTLARLLDQPKGARSEREDWDRLLAFRCHVWIDECAREIAAMFSAGQITEANALAQRVIQRDKDGSAARAVIALCVAAGQSRSELLVMLDEADKKSAPKPGLRESLLPIRK